MCDRIVLGLGGTVDYEVTCSTAVLERLVLAYRLTPGELSAVNRRLIEVESEHCCLLAFLRDGTGGERFVAPTKIVEAFAAHFDTAIALATALVEMGAVLTAPTCVIHARYWSLAAGRDAASYAPALRGGIAMASARYLHGDGYTETDYRRVAIGPVNDRGAAFADEINRRLAGMVRC